MSLGFAVECIAYVYSQRREISTLGHLLHETKKMNKENTLASQSKAKPGVKAKEEASLMTRITVHRGGEDAELLQTVKEAVVKGFTR